MKCSHRILSAGFMMLWWWNKTRACCEAAFKFKLAKVVCSCALLWSLLFKSPIFQNAHPSPPKGGIANARPSYLYEKLGRAFSHIDSFYGSPRNDMIHNMNFKYNVFFKRTPCHNNKSMSTWLYKGLDFSKVKTLEPAVPEGFGSIFTCCPDSW